MFLKYVCILNIATSVVMSEIRCDYRKMMENINRPKISITPKEADDFIAEANDILNGINFKNLFLQSFMKSTFDQSDSILQENTTTMANGTSTPHIDSTSPMSTMESLTTEQTKDKTLETTMSQTTLNTPTTNTPLFVSELCRNHTNATGEAISRRELWALAMVDAFGKPQSNILGSLGSPIMWIGDYDECMSIQANTEWDQIKYRFRGQYCVASSNVSNIGVLNLGLCVPNSCSKTDVITLLKTTVLPTVFSVSCPEHDRPFDTRATIVLVVCSIFIAFLVIGTGYDVIIIQWPNWSKGKDDSNASEIDETTHLINEHAQYTPGLLGKLILSFSVYTNITKILSTTQGAGSLTAINGIRFITMTWVILGHTMIFALQFGVVDNTSQWLPEHLNRISFGPIYNAFPAVDTFFALRLTPPYMLILMVYVSLFPYIGEGPGWPRDGAEVNYCEHSWHRNFLYVNNLFVDGYDMCMGWSWYLANDMQFYVISPLILLPLFHYHLMGVGILLAFLLGSTIACGALSAHDDLPASMFDGGNSQKFFNEYVKPWNRITPYLIGMYVGYLLYKTDCKVRINRFVNIFAWLAFTAVACTVLYGLHKDVTGDRLSTDVAALYTATHRMVWGACVCWVIFACATGNGGAFRALVSF
ncbi:unnamed protein product [Mytilus coruscus]|uniref:Nose resistant-to-fluoxetine protein N-terminal domain-containing protein n=1 Tax=Mytilus coruscus TaxID=42192 RepID=A0A6J8CUE6_MYTCO|nr:unnamed protein product [Mytilus coruscus]